MKQWILIVWTAFVLAVAGCSGGDPENLFDTAELEEKQDNLEHARQLYQRVVDEYPQTEYADMAKQRLAELDRE